MQAVKRKNKFAYLLYSSVGIRESSLCRTKCDLTKKKFGDKADSVLFTCTDIIRGSRHFAAPRNHSTQRHVRLAARHPFTMATSISFSSSLLSALPVLMKVQGKTLIHLTGPSAARLVCHRQSSNPRICLSSAVLH